MARSNALVSRCGCPPERGPLPDRLYVKIDQALNAKAVADGVNMEVGLTPGVWLKRCRRCDKPFIDLPHMRLCSEECRVEAKRAAMLRSKAKRAGRAWRERRSDQRGAIRLRPVRQAAAGVADDAAVLQRQMPCGRTSGRPGQAARADDAEGT